LKPYFDKHGYIRNNNPNTVIPPNITKGPPSAAKAVVIVASLSIRFSSG